MCGIAGIVDLQGARDVDRDALTAMTRALAHRGPDGEGFHYGPGIGFGHRRLAIIDREGGAQPFETQSRRGVITYNGEIYNYRALAAALSGVSMRTRSDTELLAEGFGQKGEAFLHELRGMFAFGYWDPAAQRLTLARDRLGERPLYYAQTNDGFLLFASEIGAIRASGLIDASLDPRGVADYFFYGYVPDPRSIWRGIHKLPAAHVLTAGPNERFRIERYWRPIFATGASLSFDDATDLLREKVDDAVKQEMIADVPLGAFLSGGVDSASIVSSMAQTGAAPIACTIGFDEKSHDERDAAAEIALKFGAVHHVETASCDSTGLIDRIASAFGEPFADASALPSFLVAEAARKHVTVALSGDGGDEIFAGYRRYPFFTAEERLRAVAPHFLRASIFGPLGALWPKLDVAPRPLRFKTTFQSLAKSSADAYAAAVAINLPDCASAILNPDVKRSLGGYRPQSVIAEAMTASGAEDPLSQALYADLMTWLPGRMLTKVDRTSMAHGLEVRPPLLDHQLVEWAGALPPAYKLKGGAGKRILKAAFTPRLGADYVSRKKRGFAPPISEWLRRETNNPLMRLNASRAWRESGLFDESVIDRMAAAHRSGAANLSQELLSVIMFDAFLRASKR